MGRKGLGRQGLLPGVHEAFRNASAGRGQVEGAPGVQEHRLQDDQKHADGSQRSSQSAEPCCTLMAGRTCTTLKGVRP